MTEIAHKKNAKVPYLTIAMPVYNAGSDLRIAVLSILKQTFTDWEFIIIDDGSTDNAISGISDILDERIIILSDGENKGLAARLNEAIDLARGIFFARMDQDDVSYPERFKRQLNILQVNKSLDVVATRAVIINEHNKVIGMHPYSLSHDDICSKPWRGFYFPHPTWLGRIEWFRKHRYAIPAHYFCEDQELLLRSYNESRFQALDETLFAYRVKGVRNWKKLIKTRVAVLQMQWCNFFLKRQFHFMVFSSVTFMWRILSDLFTMFFWKNDSRHTEDWGDVESEWVDVLNEVKREDK